MLYSAPTTPPEENSWDPVAEPETGKGLVELTRRPSYLNGKLPANPGRLGLTCVRAMPVNW